MGKAATLCRFVAGEPSVQAMLLIFIAALSVFVAVRVWRMSGELSRLGLSVRGIQVSLASLLAATQERGNEGSSPPGAGRLDAGAAPRDDGEPAAVLRGGGRGRPVTLPNGQRRVDYIRDRYYRDGASRSGIRAEINAMLAEAGEGGDVRRQVVYGATSAQTDPRGDGRPRTGGADAVD